MIDRRMINTFLVQYLNPKSDAATKQHMIDAMSKVLVFSTEEKQALGLAERAPNQQVSAAGAAGAQAAEAPKDIKGVGQALFSFLMGDDEF